jgi:fibronectin type 3 domain-containing protein
MKFWTLSTLCTASLLILSGCGGAKPIPQEKVVIDSTLPVVTLTKNGTIVDINNVAFEWKSITDSRVEGIYIYKKTPEDKLENKLKYYDTITNRFSTHYVDYNVKPDTRYSYAFKTFSKNAEGKLSRVLVVNTLPVLESVSWIHSINGMPKSAKIIWRPHANSKVKAYIIERKILEKDKWEKIATINGRLNAEFIDTNLEDNHVYMYRIRVVTYDGITSTPSKIVKVITKPLPKSIQNIKASKNLPKKIKIEWEASRQKDFSLYHLYKSDIIDGPYKLIAKLHNPIFIDKINEDGKSYFYRVSAVDKDGLESKHDKFSIQGMTLPKPYAPAIVEAKLIGSKVKLTWDKVDPRTKTYVVRKTYKKGWFDKVIKDFKGIKGSLFIDNDIKPNSTYTYVVYGVDGNKIISEPSIEVEVKIPEFTKIGTRPKTKQKDIKVLQKEDDKQKIITPSEDLDLSEI